MLKSALNCLDNHSMLPFWQSKGDRMSLLDKFVRERLRNAYFSNVEKQWIGWFCKSLDYKLCIKEMGKKSMYACMYFFGRKFEIK